MSDSKPLSGKEITKIQSALVEKIYELHQQKFGGVNTKFAKQAGCAESTIRKILAGNQNITVVMLFKIAHAFEISPSELLKF